MSKIVASAVIRGANKIYGEAEEFLNKAIQEKGESEKIEFPETAFYFPLVYALMGLEIKTLGDVKQVLAESKSLLHRTPTDKLWLPYLGDALDSGVATLLNEEVIVALRYLYGQEPQPDCNGFFSDTILRTLGIQLVDGRMPGFAAILGAAPDNKAAVEIVRELQKRSIMVFVGSNTNGRSIIDQLKEEKVEMGWDTYIVPYGRDTYTAIYPLHWAIRGALTFGGVKKGEALKALLYCKERVFAFGMALGEVDDVKYATGAGAINMGFPVIADTDIPEIRPTGICTYEHLVSEKDHKKIVPVSIEVRGVKVKVSEIPIPVSYSPAFEGERVRREQMYAQFGGKYSTAFEYVVQRDLDKLQDGKIEVVGPEVDEMKDGSAAPLGVLVEVGGRKMQKDFEPILERQVHTFLNEAMGIFHMGQRDMCWVRISKDAKNKGLKLKHFGTILHARMHEVFSAIVDKCQVTIFTMQEEVDKHIKEAKAAYDARDERIAGMTDESVDVYFSCQLCQSFAPDHVCIVKPERLGLCGAYNWMDTKASFELNPTGPNQPIKKGEVIDPVRGEWKGVNEAVYKMSNKKIESFHGYSIMSSPETSCCVEDTEVVIDNEIKQMSEFIDENFGKDEYAKSSCMTLSNGKGASEKIVAMQRFPAPKKLYGIKTKSGKELTLTANHEVAVDRAGGLMWVRADELQAGDRVISLKEEISNAIRLLPKEEVKKLTSSTEEHYFLNEICEVKEIENENKYKHVYNLTLADNHTYLANDMLIKNCGCFECVVAILPEVNGFMVVNREYAGMTPAGMKFTTLAGSVGGGAQTPGFMGIGRLYITSKKFISADGGLKRIVWMSKELKEHLGNKLKKRCEEVGGADFLSKIADETNATTMDELMPYLEKVGHPALKMDPLM